MPKKVDSVHLECFQREKQVVTHPRDFFTYVQMNRMNFLGLNKSCHKMKTTSKTQLCLSQMLLNAPASAMKTLFFLSLLKVLV